MALPVKEISAESVRDKSIRHGHISTLHLWWARRPLPVCRAVVFASLVPDPLDIHCPAAFKEAVATLLGPQHNPGDPYLPYHNIPFTAAIDPMEDNLRNRLLLFMGKFSEKFLENERNGKKTDAKDLLSPWSLIKWDNKNNESILNKARKLIWVAHDPINNTLANFEQYYQAIKKAEDALYAIPDRNNPSALRAAPLSKRSGGQEAKERLKEAIDAFQARMPSVFDPFAGGGAIPLEAARLGCRSYGNDINPVAHIVQKCSLEFPQKYGKPIIYSPTEFLRLYGSAELEKITSTHDPNAPSQILEDGKMVGVRIPNRLSFDVSFYAKKLLQQAEAEIGYLYPPDEQGNKPVAYYWARVGTCNNPSCRAEVPLLREFYLVNKPDKKIYLEPIIDGKNIEFKVAIGKHGLEPWVKNKNLCCPICHNVTSKNELKQQFIEGRVTERLIAVISESSTTKTYREPLLAEQQILQQIPTADSPQEPITPNDSRNLWLTLWGVTKWGQMFSPRQLVLMQTLTRSLASLSLGERLVRGTDRTPKEKIELARRFRKNPTASEAILWEALRNRKLAGYKFRRQHPIQGFIVDFYCHEARLVVEVDGPIHEEQREYDQARQAIIEAEGNRFHRIPSEAVEQMLPRVLANLTKTIPTPIPPLAGEGQGGENYLRAIKTYLAILVDRVAIANTAFGRYDVTRENNQHPFSRQAVALVFDYPESNPFCTSSGSAYNQLDWLTRYIESESSVPFYTLCHNASSGDVSQFAPKSLDAVVTDPPYYDAIAYADLSDFFYVWLKRTLGDVYPMAFAFPQTPKSEECTALKHHHAGSESKATQHFEHKLWQIFDAIEKQTSGVVSIMFAHQSTAAWTTLCNSILRARMNITGSWAMDTEMGNRMIALDTAALASSVTVCCRPAQQSGYGEFSEVKRAIEAKVREEVKSLYKLGFRGPDLLTACFGQAVSEFGRYKMVEKADGTEVTVAELLELARESAFNAIVSDIDTDDTTRFYIGWLNLFGFSQAEHDNVRRVTQIGLSIDVDALLGQNILLRDGNKETLATYSQRLALNPRIGDKAKTVMIDRIHKAMALFAGAPRGQLLQYIAQHAATPENPLWRVLASLAEILPAGSDDHKQVMGLLANKDSLLREAQQMGESSTQLVLELG